MAVTIASATSNFELNVMMPVIAYNLLQSIRLATNVSLAFQEKCIDGIEANKKRCEEMVENSLALVASLVPYIGYDKAAELAKKAHDTGKTIRQVCIEAKILPREKLDKLLDPRSILQPTTEKPSTSVGR